LPPNRVFHARPVQCPAGLACAQRPMSPSRFLFLFIRALTTILRQRNRARAHGLLIRRFQSYIICLARLRRSASTQVQALPTMRGIAAAEAEEDPDRTISI